MRMRAMMISPYVGSCLVVVVGRGNDLFISLRLFVSPLPGPTIPKLERGQLFFSAPFLFGGASRAGNCVSGLVSRQGPAPGAAASRFVRLHKTVRQKSPVVSGKKGTLSAEGEQGVETKPVLQVAPAR
jgi:hypothetical protein